jgi:hypothetical protein
MKRPSSLLNHSSPRNQKGHSFMYRTLGFSFISLVLGILIGGALITLLPRPNHIHLTVMPYQSVNLSPEVGGCDRLVRLRAEDPANHYIQ